MYRLEPLTLTALPWFRLLFQRWTAEQRAPYPVVDEPELDRLVVHMARQLHNPDYFCRLAWIGRRAVGMVAGQPILRAFGQPALVARAHFLYVVPKHRQRGVGPKLISAFCSWATTLGTEHIEFEEGASFTNLWAKHHFTPYATIYHTTIREVCSKLVDRPRKVSA